MTSTKSVSRGGAGLDRTNVLPLARMALRFYEEAEQATGDERHASLIASAALMAAVDRLHERRRRDSRRLPERPMKAAS